MNISSFRAWSETASENTNLAGIGITGAAPIRNFSMALRELMAQLRAGASPLGGLLNKAGSYTALKGDAGSVLRFTASSVLTLPIAASVGSGWSARVIAEGGPLTILPTGSEQIDGLAMVTLPAGFTTLVMATESGFCTTREWATLTSLIPAGAVQHFARTSPPTGWLRANGALASRTVYASLFASVGTTFGAGDGATTFALPDLRGEALRGWDDGRGVDPGRALGSWQGDEIRAHSHAGSTSSDGAHAHSYSQPAFVSYPNGSLTGSPGYLAVSAANTSTAGAHAHSLTIVPFGGAEARPRNVSLLACIKF